MKAKGRYVALIEIDFTADLDSLNKVTFAELSNRMHNGWMERAVSVALETVVKGSYGEITVTPQLADVYEVEDGEL